MDGLISRVDERFCQAGIQFYIAARASFLAGLHAICGNLYHHAAEACLKGRLSNRYSLEELSQRRWGHNLRALWEEFKIDYPGSGLEEFDGTIADINKFDRLRYPDAIVKEGAEIIIGGRFLSPRSETVQRYQLDVEAIDHLIARLLECCSRNPFYFTAQLNTYGRDALVRNNPVGDSLAPPEKQL